MPVDVSHGSLQYCKVMRFSTIRSQFHSFIEFKSDFVVNIMKCICNIQVCRNINRIKVCMETGQTVVLLNLENLYESLYDALNQVSGKQ